MQLTLEQLNVNWPGYWHTGKGRFAVVCSSDRRVTFCETKERGLEMLHTKCGRKCDHYQSPHVAVLLANEPKPAPKQSVSRWFRQMVEEA